VKNGREGTEEANYVKSELNKLEAESKMFHDPAFEAALRLKRGDL